MNVIEAIHDEHLFRRFLPDLTSWSAWLIALRAIFALPMPADDQPLFRRCTGRTQPFAKPVNETWLMVGRRGGKSFISAITAVFLAAFRDYSTFMAPGERGFVMVLAVNRDQAAVIFRYILALIDGTPMLARMVVGRAAESIELDNGIVIEVGTASFRSVRGRTIVAAICDEIAFWRSEESRNPDKEILDALRPAMATIPTAMLVCLSSPYARSGALFDAHERHWGNDSSEVMFWKAPSQLMNPSLRASVIVNAFADDAQVAGSEYGDLEHGISFRSDVQAAYEQDWITDAIDQGCHQRPPMTRQGYLAFVDPSGGKKDSFALGIAHKQGDCAFLDVAREWKAPLDPASVVAEIAMLVKPYGIRTVVGDAYSGEWCQGAFREAGLTYTVSALTASEVFLETGPLLAQGRVRLVDSDRLSRQLQHLERRTSPGGRDRVGHPPGGHDDLAVAACGAVQLAYSKRAGIRRDRLNFPTRCIGVPDYEFGF